MEVNKDEAKRCLDIARRHLSSGNYASAKKFGNKSISLYPTPEATAFLSRLEQEEGSNTNSSSNPGSSASFSAQPSASSSSSSSSARPSVTSARPRSTTTDHKPVERDYTPEQAAAVKKIRSSGGDFYKVLGIEKDASDAEIKKAYRKLALQMHPDKNGAPGADEAFKIVSKAFTVLSDPQKRAIFDQHGPDDGKSTGVNYDRASPMGHGFGGGRGMNGYEEVSPEELFNMFFGGGSFGGSFHSATFAGPGFGRPHFRARTHTQHQQRRQQRQYPQQQAGEGGGVSGLSSLIQILPLILLFIMSMTSNFFSDSDSSSSGNVHPAASDFSLGKHGSYQVPRWTSSRNVQYFVNERKFKNAFYVPGQDYFDIDGTVNGVRVRQIMVQLETNVEKAYMKYLQNACANEERARSLAFNRAFGFLGVIFGPDRAKWEAAQNMKTTSCDILYEKFGTRR
ncbi:hypothetical protein BGX34_003441 [Mortierella sp. NVP85]|nr:hypothetical protein BGX34_003441 [Mortierella sp. NVP85]